MNNISAKYLVLPFMIGVFLFGDIEKTHASDDWQYWNEFILKHRIVPHLETHLKLEQRLVDNFGELGLHNYAPGMLYTVSEHFNFELNYRYEREKVSQGWIEEHRLEIIPVLKWRLNEFGFKFRSRLEYRNIESAESWRLREKIKISREAVIDDFDFTPFISEEIFYDFRVGEFNQNEIIVGVSKTISQIVGIGLYYMYQSNKKENDWSGANVLGTEFEIAF